MESDKANLNNAEDKDKLELPYEHCLNCGEKLNGICELGNSAQME